MSWLLYKLGNADGRLTRQDRLCGHRFGRGGGCPPPPHPKPTIIEITAPQTRPQIPYLIFPAFSGFIDNTSPKFYYDIFAYDDLAINELDEVIGPGLYLIVFPI
jgi:hypothetical protein